MSSSMILLDGEAILINDPVEKNKKDIYAMLPYFENTMIVGDSLAESILDFRLLRKNNVLARRGACIDMIDEVIKTILKVEPSVLFLEFGKNDILQLHGDLQKFITSYREKIQMLKEKLPHSRLYVNSIIPMHPYMMKKDGNRKICDLFNQALQLMCLDENVIFIDNSSILEWKADVFEYDGIHPKYPYYPKWLFHMAKIAGLVK